MLTSIFTFLGSSFVSSMWQYLVQKQQDTHEREMALIAQRKTEVELQAKETESARKVDSDSWIKRAMAIIVVFSIVLLPKLVMILKPDLLMTFGYFDIFGGGLFSSTKETIKYIVIDKGFLITPFDTLYCEMVLGMYFGRSIVRR